MDIVCKTNNSAALSPEYDENYNLTKIFAAEDAFISPDEVKAVSTGIVFKFPEDVGLMFFPPSELTSKTGLRYDYPNHAFVIQNNYYHQEELKIRFKNSYSIKGDAKRVSEYKLIDGTIVTNPNNLYNEGTVKICKGDCIAIMKQVPAFYDETEEANTDSSVKVAKKNGDKAIKSEHGKVVSTMDKKHFIKIIELALKEFLGKDYSPIAIWGIINDVKDNEVKVEVVSRQGSEPDENYKIYEFHAKNLIDNQNLDFIICNTTVLFSKKTINDRRRWLNKMKGVVTIKQHFLEDSRIPFSIVFLGEKKNELTWFAYTNNAFDLWKRYEEDGSEPALVCIVKRPDPVNYLPEYYLSPVTESFHNEKTVLIKELQDLAEVIIGASVKANEKGGRGIPYIRPRCIKNNSEIEQEELYVDERYIDKYKGKMLQEGDILLPRQFMSFKLGYVRQNNLPAIASDGLFIIRPFGIGNKYLGKYLSSKTGRSSYMKQLRQIQKGGVIPYFTQKDLKHLKVPVYDKEVMDDIESADTINASKGIEFITKITNNLHEIIPSKNLEEMVINSFLKRGWNADNLLKPSKPLKLFNALTEFNFTPDVILLDSGKPIAVVEIKTDFSNISKEWLKRMEMIVKNSQKLLLVLTTGIYYEIYTKDFNCIWRAVEAPTFDEVVRLSKEVNS